MQALESLNESQVRTRQKQFKILSTNGVFPYFVYKNSRISTFAFFFAKRDFGKDSPAGIVESEENVKCECTYICMEKYVLRKEMGGKKDLCAVIC